MGPLTLALGLIIGSFRRNEGMAMKRVASLKKQKWLRDQGSNLGNVVQSHVCYHYTIPQRFQS